MNYFIPETWRSNPRLEMALVPSVGIECSVCERMHFRPDGLLTIDMNGGGRICPVVSRLLIDELEAGRPVRIIRAMSLEPHVSYLELMPASVERVKEKE